MKKKFKRKDTDKKFIFSIVFFFCVWNRDHIFELYTESVKIPDKKLIKSERYDENTMYEHKVDRYSLLKEEKIFSIKTRVKMTDYLW